jgi:hypothetical protein
MQAKDAPLPDQDLLGHLPHGIENRSLRSVTTGGCVQEVILKLSGEYGDLEARYPSL